MDPEPSQEPPSTPRTSETPASVEKTEIDGMSGLRNSFTNYNISGHVATGNPHKRCGDCLQNLKDFYGNIIRFVL